MEELRPADKVAIAVYAGAAGLVLESTACTGDNKDIIITAFDNLQAGGSTAGGAGLKLAYKMAHKNQVFPTSYIGLDILTGRQRDVRKRSATQSIHDVPFICPLHGAVKKGNSRWNKVCR